MMTRCWKYPGGALAAIALAAGLSAVPKAGTAETFIHAHVMPEEHILHPTSKAFMEKLEELSGGKMKVEYHLGGDLGDWVTLFEQTMQGALPMTMTWGPSEFDVRLDIAYLGYVVDDWDKAERVYGPDGAMNPIFESIFDDLDMKYLGAVPIGFYGLATRKGEDRVPTNFPEECDGLKLRVPPMKIAVKRFEALGCSPVPMPFSELYNALQLGTVDGRTFGPAAEIWQMRDVEESYVFLRDSFETAFWLANGEWWDGLSKQEQEWVQQAADHALSFAWNRAQKDEQRHLENVADYGVNVVELSPEQLAEVKRIVYENEWPWMEEQIGKVVVDKVRKAADLENTAAASN
jgi:TRAP-type C4-dicarboxylate transport system substrate-binding protein